MIIVFFGPPGSGKGTQAQELKKVLKGMVHVSTGDLLRQEIASGSDIGCKIQSVVQAGQFPTDDIVMELIAAIIQKNQKKDIIFDGFPRTLNQAIAFDALLGVEDLKVDVVFDFEVGISQLMDRVSGRYSCRSCGAVYHEKNEKPKLDSVCDQCGFSDFEKRPDDTAEVLKTRLRTYQEKTLPVQRYYRDKGVLKKVDASLPKGKVASFISTALLEAGLMRRGE